MKTWQKAVFVLVLVFFVTVSVTISLISISRPPYKYAKTEAEGAVSWTFASFNGNASTTALHIDFVRDRNGEAPDEARPVSAVGAYAVNADEYVEELFLGADVREIEETSFFNMKKLRRVTVDPANEAFKDVDGVLYTKDGKRLLLYPACYGQTPEGEDFSYPEAYTVPEGVERVSTLAFLKNTHLRDLKLPSTLKEVGDMAFFGCSRLGAFEYDKASDALVGTGLSLPDGLETIGADAFSRCGSLGPVLYLPSSVREIGHHAFFACTGVKEIFFGAQNEEDVSLGEACLPKSIKSGAMWKAPSPEYAKTAAQAEERMEEFRAERLNAFREEAEKNG